jgi:hypothetical protein
MPRIHHPQVPVRLSIQSRESHKFVVMITKIFDGPPLVSPNLFIARSQVKQAK